MEVHHHNHIKGKKWTHYLWEFLMLFLAVFCGFLAENQREHMLEHQREKQYMHSLLYDLEKDTSNFNEAIKGNISSTKKIDSLIGLLKNTERNKWTGKIYLWAKEIVFEKPYVAVNKAYEQMKSSGNLRLVHDISLIDSLGSYYYDFNYEEKFGPPQMQFEVRHDLFMYYDKLFDASVFQKIISPPNLATSASYFIMPEGNPPLLKNDAVVINEICMRLHNIYFVRRVIIGRARHYLKRATYLIKKIEDEYHL